MYNSVIVGYSRSPFAMANKGKLIDVKPVNLLAKVIKNLVSQSKINPKEIDDVVIGCAFQVGEQCFNIGRLVTFLSDLDMRVPGMSVDRWCGSSMEAIHIAAGKIAMKLDTNDKIVGVKICKDDQDIILSTKLGKCIRFESKKLRIFKGRSSKGIKGIVLAPNDQIVSLSIIDSDKKYFNSSFYYYWCISNL